MRHGLVLVSLAVLVTSQLMAATGPPVSRLVPGVQELTPEQKRQLEARMPEIRAQAIAAARRALANPEFVAAVHQMTLTQSTGINGQNRVAVPLQLAAGLLYYYGTGKIRNAILQPLGINFGAFPPRLRRFTPSEAANLNPAKELAIGVSAIGAAAAMAYLSPPVEVEQGFRDMSFPQRLDSVRSHAWQVPGPPLIEEDVDDISDPASCSSALALRVDGDRVTGFGEFTEEELVWTYPFGSYPSLAEVVPTLVNLISQVLPSFPGLDVSDIIGEINGVGEFPVPVSIGDFINRLINSALNVEGFFYDNFDGWTLEGQRITCPGGACRAPDGLSWAVFRGSVDTVPGILGYDFSFQQSIRVKEYFPPVFTGLQEHLRVYYEALEPGGVPTSLPPVDYDGSPVSGHSQILDPTWFGLQDNCDPRPVLEWHLPDFLPLGIQELTVRATDRSGNVTETTVTVVVQDSLPPDILPPDDVGITVPPDALSIGFNDPGIGCTGWLCEGDPPEYTLYPPLSFDFGSLEPVITCAISNSLYTTPKDCDDADALLTVGENTLTWGLTDPSGNESTVSQRVVVRSEGSNRTPTVQDGTFTIPSGVPVDLPLAGSDPDLDPLTFTVKDLPGHGDLGLTAEAIFQTRFSSSGAIRRATSFIKLSGISGSGNEPTDLLIVADGPGHKLLIFDIVNPDSLYLYDMVDTGAIAPDAIQLPGYPRAVDGHSLSSVLQDLWIADFTDEGNGDPSVNTLWRNATSAASMQKMADLGPSWPAGAPHGRDFRVDAATLSGQDQTVDLTVYVTGDPPLTTDNPPTFSPANLRLGFHLASSDDGRTWTTTVTDPGTAESATSTVNSYRFFGCSGVFNAFWSTSPPWGELSGPHPLSYFLADPDGTGPALPRLQDPTASGLSSCGNGGGTALILESQNDWLHAFDFDGTSGSTPTELSNQCDPSNPPAHTTCSRNFLYPLKLTRFINLRSIEEIPSQGGQPRFVILDDSGVYRFDLANRLEAFISFSGGASNSAPPQGGSSWADVAVDPAGHVFILSSSDQDEASVSFVERWTVSDGVGNFHDNGRRGTFGNTGDKAWAVAADGANVFALGGAGLYRWANDLSDSGTQLSTSAHYRDVEIRTGTNEIFLTEIDGSTQRVVRMRRDTGAVIATFGQGSFDFNAGNPGNDLSGVMYGRMAYDAAADRLYVADNPVSGSQRIPRVRVFSGDGTLLETIVPDASPNIFASWLQPGDFGSVSDLAVGPGRVYVAEVAPLKRLHVFDATTAYPVPCPDPTEECRQVHFIPDAAYTGPDSFSYTASDTFHATSDPPGVLNLSIIDDTTPPTIDCPANLGIEARDNGGVTLTDPLDREPNADLRAFFSPTVTDNVDLPEPTLSHDGGTSFPVGATVVTFTATDGAGNVSTCQATLTVTDTTPPVFLDPDGNPLPGPVAQLPVLTVEATAPQTPYTPPAPPVSDLGGIAGLSSTGPATYPVGETRIVWTATDTGGNIATAEQIVRIVDTTPPEFITPLPPDDTYSQVAVSGWANPAVYDPQEATDLVGVVDIHCGPAIGDPVPIGVNTVDCVATDAAGNIGRRTFFVDVEDGDRDGDGLGDLVDLAPTLPSTGFSSPRKGGETTGVVVGGDHPLLVTAGPRQGTGVSVAVAGRRGSQPSEVALCDGRLHAWLKFTQFEVQPGVVEEGNDQAILTCLKTGTQAESELGSIKVSYQLPQGGAATVILDSGEAGRLEGWIFTVPASSSGEVQVTAGGTTVAVAPGASRNLVELVMGPSADLVLSGWSDPAKVGGGQPLLVQFNIGNRGPSDAGEGVSLAIALPRGVTKVTTHGCANDPLGVPTCTIPAIRMGAVAHVGLTMTVARNAGPELRFGGTVAASKMFDPVVANNAAAVVVPVTTATRPPTLAVSFAPQEIPFLEGISTMTIRLENPDDSPAAVAAAFDGALPSGLVVAGSPNLLSTCGGTASAAPGAHAISLAGATLDPGAGCTVSADVTVDPDAAEVGPATARVTPVAGGNSVAVPTEATLTLTPVTSFTGPVPDGAGDATVRFTGGGEACTFTRVAWRAPGAVAAPGNLGFPNGLLSFTTKGCTPGGTLELTVTGPSPLEGAAGYWSFGATADTASPHWSQLAADISGDTAVLALTDGTTGDGDAAADGSITHTGGVAAPGQRAIPVLGPAGTLLLFLLIAIAGAFLLAVRL